MATDPRDTQDTIRELALDDAQAEATLLDRKLARDPNVGNEERAQLVADCFCDYAEALDIPQPFANFCLRFPTLSELY
jgi:hypothetical protein